MKNIVSFTLISTLAILSSCMLPNNTTILEPKKEVNTDLKLKEEFIQRVKNKKNNIAFSN